MGAAGLRIMHLTRRFRLGTVSRSRYYCSSLQSSELKAAIDNSADKDKSKPDPTSDEVKNIAKEESTGTSEGDEPEMVDMWNKDAIAGPEWNGPRGYEPTKYGDWSSKGRVTDF